ncbi:unknown [Ruminococcus sp. CAG:579]|nr:unknown [Ruminococcus sp. CAG:579]
MYYLGVVSHGGIYAAEVFKAIGSRARFLFQLPNAALAVVFAKLQLARRQLVKRRLERVAELLYHINAALFVERQNAYTAGVADKLALGLVPIIQLHVVHIELYHLAVVYLAARCHFFFAVHLKKHSPFRYLYHCITARRRFQRRQYPAYLRYFQPLCPPELFQMALRPALTQYFRPRAAQPHLRAFSFYRKQSLPPCTR